MIALPFRRAATTKEQPPLQPSTAMTEPVPDGGKSARDDRLRELLRDWDQIGEVQVRIAENLLAEIRGASDDVETESIAVVKSFQRVLTGANAQTERISQIARLGQALIVGGRTIEDTEISATIECAVERLVARVVDLSQQSGSTVTMLVGMRKSVDLMERCITEVEGINQQAHLLSLNAQIEAARAGVEGAGFDVIAREIRELSGQTSKLAANMGLHLREVLNGLGRARETLGDVASVDMSTYDEIKATLNALLIAIGQRSAAVEKVVVEAGVEADALTAQIRQIITSMQFQDRVAQRLMQVCDTMGRVNNAVTEMREKSSDELPSEPQAQFSEGAPWLRDLLDRYKLSEMRARFEAALGGGAPTAGVTAAPAAAGGSFDLF